MSEPRRETAHVRKSVLGELTESARRWQNRAHNERQKRQRWRKRALAAEAEVAAWKRKHALVTEREQFYRAKWEATEAQP